MIFTAKQLKEKCQEQTVNIYITFVDLIKAFETISRDELWCGIFMIELQARAQNDGEYSKIKPFPVLTNGVKQGCGRTPTLFSMMIPAMPTDAF